VIELLSPAGNRERLEYALAYGADAVYMAGSRYSLRAFADNFEPDELKRALELVHSKGKKAYITVNIYAHNSDIDGMEDYFRFLYDIGADAVLVSDLGVLEAAKKGAPELPVHISTQANVTNYAAARFFCNAGAERIVLARELSIEEIALIHQKVPQAELEAFVHGAACISYSGRCLLSDYLTGRSANQGKCAQPCRWGYELVPQGRADSFPIAQDERGTYILNSKDLCMIDHLGELADAGVTSFKIEGRMKTAYYTAAVTNAYRRATDRLEAGLEPDPALKEELAKAANREFTTGFYFGPVQQGQRYESSKCRQSHEFSAVVLSSNGEYLTLEQRNRFRVGDVLEVLSPEPSRCGQKFTVESIISSQGCSVQAAPNPQERVKVPCTLRLEYMDILRRKL
jgi:peptidase U32